MPEIVSPPASRTARPTLAADIIIANAPDPVFVCDLEGKILEANDAVSRALALTAYARSEDRVLALEAGFHTHIAKPVDPLELTALIAGLAPDRRD